ncbi:acyltransferase like protein [Zymoseptoria brevis]|uniref:Acyltransferase like protein n=1 Tax=Zymoseptoria brevis TaxID=1047168 RepID=A0A0F4GST5_9PEZI|nr:acyltransferase like protein [Zymoseptoria brevis]
MLAFLRLSPREYIHATTPMTYHDRAQQALAILRDLRRSVSPNSPRTTAKPRPPRPTAWLDGLRGIAAFAVFVMHNEDVGHQVADYVILENPWGLSGQHHLVTFPIVRTLFSGGHTAVFTFFIISGFVLSYKPLQLVHAQDLGLLVKSTGSGLFRRWGRLFLPLYVSTFCWMSSWYMFGFDSGRGDPKRLPSWTEELGRWWDNHSSGNYVGYNVHLWTIPEEFWGSVFTYCTILATSRFTHEARLVTETAICAYRLYLSKRDALFIVGILFCDVFLLAEAGKLPNILKRLAPRYNALWYIPFLLGLYIAPFGHGFAGDIREFSGYPGWSILSFLTPPHTDFKFFLRFWASTMIVVSIPHLDVCKRILEGRLAQYLGRISYGLYLIHGPILWSVGVRLYAACGLDNRYPDLKAWDNLVKIPEGGPLGLEPRFLVPWTFVLVLVLGLSELFTRCVDEPIVKLMQWCFSSCQRLDSDDRKDRQSTLPLLEMRH